MRALPAAASICLVSLALTNPVRADWDDLAFPFNFSRFLSNDPLIKACGYDIERRCKGISWSDRGHIIRCLDADKARLTVECLGERNAPRSVRHFK